MRIYKQTLQKSNKAHYKAGNTHTKINKNHSKQETYILKTKHIQNKQYMYKGKTHIKINPPQIIFSPVADLLFNQNFLHTILLTTFTYP